MLGFWVAWAAEQAADGSFLIMVCCEMNSESESEVWDKGYDIYRKKKRRQNDVQATSTHSLGKATPHMMAEQHETPSTLQ